MVPQARCLSSQWHRPVRQEVGWVFGKMTAREEREKGLAFGGMAARMEPVLGVRAAVGGAIHWATSHPYGR